MEIEKCKIIFADSNIKGQAHSGIAHEQSAFRMCPNHFDQSSRDIGMEKFRTDSRTLRANVEVFSLDNVRSPAVIRLSEPGVAPLSRAYPRLEECRPFRTFASLRDQTRASLCSSGSMHVSAICGQGSRRNRNGPYRLRSALHAMPVDVNIELPGLAVLPDWLQ